MLCRLRETRGRVLWTDKAEFEDMSVVPCHALSFDRSYATAATKLEPCEIASNLRSIELSGLPYSWDMYISDSEDSCALDERSCTMVANEATYGMLVAFAKTVCGDSSIHNSIDELLDAYRTIPCTYDGVSRLGNGRSTPNAYQSFRSIGTESNGTSIYRFGPILSCDPDPIGESLYSIYKAKTALSDALDIAGGIWMTESASALSEDTARRGNRGYSEYTPFNLILREHDSASIEGRAEKRLTELLEFGREIGIDSIISAISNGIPIEDVTGCNIRKSILDTV